MPKFRVTVDYVTSHGNPASIRREVSAADTIDAYDAVTGRVRRMKRCMKINGGTIEEICRGIPLWAMIPEALADIGKEA